MKKEELKYILKLKRLHKQCFIVYDISIEFRVVINSFPDYQTLLRNNHQM